MFGECGFRGFVQLEKWRESDDIKVSIALKQSYVIFIGVASAHSIKLISTTK